MSDEEMRDGWRDGYMNMRKREREREKEIRKKRKLRKNLHLAHRCCRESPFVPRKLSRSIVCP